MQPNLPNRCQEPAIHLLKVNFPNYGYTSSKAAAFVNHKGPFKAQCSHMEKHMFYLASAKETSLPPPTPKYLGNIPAMCVPIMDSFSLLLLFYTFSITSCCFPPTQLKKEKRKKAFLSHRRANLYMKTTLSKAGSPELTQTVNLPNWNNNDTLTQPFHCQSHCHVGPDGLLPNYTPLSTQVIKWGRKGSPPGYIGRRYNEKSIKTSSSLSSPFGIFWLISDAKHKNNLKEPD